MTMRNENRKTRSQGGYSLIETLIAMAILGSVLLSVLMLFVWGRKNVYSGKQMTRAVAVGTRVMEDLSSLTRKNVQDGFNLSGATLGTVTVAGKSYTNSVKRESTDTTNDTLGYLAKWNALLTQENFTSGLVTLVVTPIDPMLVSGTPSLTGSPIYRIRVYVQWREEARRRSIVLDTTKVDRTN
jgi:prepilin-type N-terminal cleavage/methylation domain-containing protein